MHIDRQRAHEIGLWVGYVFLVAAVNATSVLIEFRRYGQEVKVWEPFVWEYSSGVFLLLLIPFVLAVEKRVPFTPADWRPALAVHFAATFPFSLLHVGGMVGVRSLIYSVLGRHYDFGDTLLELFYEWRKDALTYGFIIFVVNAYRIYRERAEGNANYVDAAASAPVHVPGFRVTKNGRDIFVAPDQIDWIEAAGNYVVLHSGKNTYMMRDTMKAIEDKLADTPFIRVHRSAMVNLHNVEALETDSAGPLVELRSGRRIPVSKRLLPDVRARFAAAGPRRD